MTRHLRIPLLLLLPLILVGCTWEQNAPTEPTGLSRHAEVSVDLSGPLADAPAGVRSLGERCNAGIASACLQVASYLEEEGGNAEAVAALLYAGCEASYAGACLRAAALRGATADARRSLTERACALGLQEGCIALADLHGGASDGAGHALLATACEAGDLGACGALEPFSARRSDPPAPPRPPASPVPDAEGAEEDAPEAGNGTDATSP